MGKFRTWYLEYQNEITWFVVGLLAANMLQHAAKGEWLFFGIDAALAVINIHFWRQNRV